MRRVLALAILLLFSCKKEQSAGFRTRAYAPQDSQSEAKAVAAPARSAEPPRAPAPNRMIVRTATVSLVVRDAVVALRNITTAVEAKGGYVGETKQWRERDQVRATATLRVPASALDSTLAEIRKNAIRVESENVSGQDVSEEYADLGAQLTNMQAAEKELRELLTTVRQRTQKAADILEVYTELTKVRGDIERIQGRMKYLSQVVAMSTVNVDLVPDVLAQPVVEPGWRPLAVLRNAARELVSSIRWLADALIWIGVYFLPLGLILVLIALFVRFVWRRLRRVRGVSPREAS